MFITLLAFMGKSLNDVPGKKRYLLLPDIDHHSQRGSSTLQTQYYTCKISFQSLAAR